MDFNEWVNTMPEEQRKEFEALDDDKVVQYLSDHDIALPDELLEDVAGGINPFALLGQALKRRLSRK